MKEFIVRVNDEGKRDLRSSYLWGVENWKQDQAKQWLAEIENKVFSRLSVIPLAFPIAPESKEYGIEIRQLKFRRYRILFTVKGMTVVVLRLRGPFNGKTKL